MGKRFCRCRFACSRANGQAADVTKLGPGKKRSALAQKLDSIDAEVASLHERARLLRDEIVANMAEVINRRLLTLSILTGFLLPRTMGHRLLRHEHQGPAVMAAPGGLRHSALAIGRSDAKDYFGSRAESGLAKSGTESGFTESGFAESDFAQSGFAESDFAESGFHVPGTPASPV